MAFLLCHRSRLGFGLDRRFHDFDKLPAPSLVFDLREGPDQPQQLYFFGHGSLLAHACLALKARKSILNVTLKVRMLCVHLRSGQPVFSPPGKTEGMLHVRSHWRLLDRPPPAPASILLLMNAANQNRPFREIRKCVSSTPCCACATSTPR
jgi:hypothetical protein